MKGNGFCRIFIMITSTSVVVRTMDDKLHNYPCENLTQAAEQFEYACCVLGALLTTKEPTVYQVLGKEPIKHITIGSASDSVSILQRFVRSRLRDAVGLRLRRRFKPSYEWWGNSTSLLAGGLCDTPSKVSYLQDELYCGSSEDCLKNLCNFYGLMELLLPQMAFVGVGRPIVSSLLDDGGCFEWMKALTGLLSSLGVEFNTIQGWRASKISRQGCPLTEKYERLHANYARLLAKTVSILCTVGRHSAISWDDMENWKNNYLSAVRSLLLAQVVMSLDVIPCNGESSNQVLLNTQSLLNYCEEKNLNA